MNLCWKRIGSGKALRRCDDEKLCQPLGRYHDTSTNLNDSEQRADIYRCRTHHKARLDPWDSTTLVQTTPSIFYIIIMVSVKCTSGDAPTFAL